MIEDGLIKMREGHLEGRPCWRILPEELGVDSIDRGEVLHVLEQHGGLHHMLVVAAGSLGEVSHVDNVNHINRTNLEEVPHVDQRLPGLLLHPVHQLPVCLHQQLSQYCNAQCVHWTVGFPCSKKSPVVATGECSC